MVLPEELPLELQPITESDISLKLSKNFQDMIKPYIDKRLAQLRAEVLDMVETQDYPSEEP